MTVDELAQIIRTVDGENKLGAGALAEAILAAPSASMGRVTAEVIDALISACNQIEYLHGKFEETGSGNAMIASLTDLRRRLQAASLPNQESEDGR